ncbi:PH domain-containing protein [Auraticoccus monumenti]|uniref:PH domain-containing protein n=1 Tax=Auraticoccus monumenti TaxID=675864 RepID=A0A1G7D0M8_9ACTN|nr:PH domain-containing protein [Auraticoccus monumenti]SDE44285.1 PH domain-containing protein [Auraticoccus monumenti]
MFRPRVLLAFSSVVSVLFVVACLVGWYAIGDVRSQFTGLQVGTLVLFVVWIVGLMMAMALSVVVVEESRLVVRNGVVTRRYAFSDIRAVRYREGDSWAYLELHETGTAGEHLRRQCLAIQRVDGARSQADAARLRDLIRARR